MEGDDVSRMYVNQTKSWYNSQLSISLATLLYLINGILILMIFVEMAYLYIIKKCELKIIGYNILLIIIIYLYL
jgi:hypothetical protein